MTGYGSGTYLETVFRGAWQSDMVTILGAALWWASGVCIVSVVLCIDMRSTYSTAIDFVDCVQVDFVLICVPYRGMSRSRRKSCQACAESKVKCDLQHPCSKCRTRGRDCVYIGGHNVASSSASGDNPSARRSEDLEAELLAMLDTATIPAEAHGPMGPVSLPNNYLDMMRTSAVRSGSPHVTATSISSFSPFMPAPETPVAFSIDSLATFARIDQTAPPPESQFDEVMQNEMFGGFFGSIFTPGRQALPPTYNSAAASSKKSPMDSGVFDNDGSIWDPGFPFSITAPMDLPRDAPLPSQDSPSLSSATSFSSPAATDATTSTSSAPVSRSAPSSPSPAELQTYGTSSS